MGGPQQPGAAGGMDSLMALRAQTAKAQAAVVQNTPDLTAAQVDYGKRGGKQGMTMPMPGPGKGNDVFATAQMTAEQAAMAAQKGKMGMMDLKGKGAPAGKGMPGMPGQEGMPGQQAFPGKGA